MVKILYESTSHSEELLDETFVRIIHVAGKFLQDFACCMNRLSGTSMQGA